MLRFRRMRSLQKFAAVRSPIDNLFNQERHLSSRDNLNSTAPPLSTSGVRSAPPENQRPRANGDWFGFV
jgi:hypothetical protein